MEAINIINRYIIVLEILLHVAIGQVYTEMRKTQREYYNKNIVQVRLPY